MLPAAQVVAGGAAAGAAMEGGEDEGVPGAAGQEAAQPAAHLRMGSLPTALTCALYNERLVRPAPSMCFVQPSSTGGASAHELAAHRADLRAVQRAPGAPRPLPCKSLLVQPRLWWPNG